MSEPPFLNRPASETHWRGSVPDAVFDLAVNRAARQLLGVPEAAQERTLAQWHARTRFVRRVPLVVISAVLEHAPAGEWHWQGGPEGQWHSGPPPWP